jgi:hypothetical protein
MRRTRRYLPGEFTRTGVAISTREVEGSARLDVDDSVGVVFVDLWHDEDGNES